MVETQSDEILDNAATEDVSLLVVGDPFGCGGDLTSPSECLVTFSFAIIAPPHMPISFSELGHSRFLRASFITRRS